MVLEVALFDLAELDGILPAAFLGGSLVGVRSISAVLDVVPHACRRSEPPALLRGALERGCRPLGPLRLSNVFTGGLLLLQRHAQRLVDGGQVLHELRCLEIVFGWLAVATTAGVTVAGA